MKEEVLETQSVREGDAKGMHTTTMRQMKCLDNNAMIIDTPGMREFASMGIENGISITFSDISSITKECKFNDCSHTIEHGCAVIEALNNGDITEERYKSYLKLRKENEFNEMSYHEKRKKDKDFGKMIKRVQKQRKKYKY